MNVKFWYTANIIIGTSNVVLGLLLVLDGKTLGWMNIGLSVMNFSIAYLLNGFFGE